MDYRTPPPSATDPRLTPSASWLYWVAGLSAVNTVIHASGGTMTFSMGLGLTQYLSGIGNVLGPMAKTITIVASVVVIVILALLGYMACRGAVWAFIAGIVILILDTLLLIPVASTAWLSIAFHIWAIVSLFMGLKIARETPPEARYQ